MQSIKQFKIKEKYEKIMGNIDEEEWTMVFRLPHDILKDNKIKLLQYRILYDQSQAQMVFHYRLCAIFDIFTNIVLKEIMLVSF